MFNPIQMQFDADTSSLLMSEGSAELIPITTSNVKTTGGRFSVLADAEGVGRGVDMRFELSGHAYDIHEYLLP